MACTMRNWESPSNTRGVAGALLRSTSRGRSTLRSSFSLARTEHPADLKENENNNSILHNGPELLLTPVVEYITNRDDSPARSRHRTSSFSKVAPLDMMEQQQQQSNLDRKPYAIAVEDILVVNCTYSGSNSLHITTLSSGFFEFSCGTANGHDILLAFLQASLDPERIIQEQPSFVKGISHSHGCGGVPSGGSSVTSCLDIDALQAQHLEFRATAETWPEKLSRRVGHVFQNLQELSGAICDSACCPAAQHETKLAAAHHHAHNTSEPRTPPPPSRHANTNFPDELEIDDNTTDCSPKPVQTMTESGQTKTKDRQLHNLPSGLSVEDSQTSNE